MDDHTSRQQIDELADLFLTGVVANDDPNNNDNDPAPSPIEGPAPIRLSPKPDGSAINNTPPTDDSHANLRLPDEEIDQPALRLTDDSPDYLQAPAYPQREENAVTTTVESEPYTEQPLATQPAPKAVLEATLLGNLPGMSGPWLTQYAQLLAQTDGPVALLHVTDSAIDLEIIEPRLEAQPAPLRPVTPFSIPPMRGDQTGLVGLLDALTRSETTPTRTVLVRLEPGNDELTLTRLSAIDDWTMLCGSDDASIAGASQQLRSMVRSEPRLADRSVGLMVMGSDEDAARTAAQRITQDLEHDLAHPIELIGHLKRMQPVQVREIGSFPNNDELWQGLADWFSTLEAPEPRPAAPQPTPDQAPAPRAQTPAPTEEIQPQRLSPAAAKLAAASSRPEPSPAFRPTPPTNTAPPRTRASRPRASRPAPTPTPSPRATNPNPTNAGPASTATQTAPVRAGQPTRPAPAPRVLTPKPELDLVALISQGPAALVDPAVLEARIPDQPATQLAVDAAGVVHVLANSADDPKATVMQLIEAGTWVREHLELIALTQRDRSFVDQEPVLHLLTDRADLTTQLVGKLASRLRLHLLQQVQIGRETGWFCTPLG